MSCWTYCLLTERVPWVVAILATVTTRQSSVKSPLNRSQSDRKPSALDMRRAEFRLLREPMGKAPWENAFGCASVHHCWSLFKLHLQKPQHQAIPKYWKSSRPGRRLAWLSRDLFLKTKRKRRCMPSKSKIRWMWQEYRNAAHHCREKIHVNKPQLGLKTARTVEDNTKRGFKYMNGERHCRS